MDRLAARKGAGKGVRFILTTKQISPFASSWQIHASVRRPTQQTGAIHHRDDLDTIQMDSLDHPIRRPDDFADHVVQGFPGEEQSITPGGYAIIRDLTTKECWVALVWPVLFFPLGMFTPTRIGHIQTKFMRALGYKPSDANPLSNNV